MAGRIRPFCSISPARRRVPRLELVYANSDENQRVETVIQQLTKERLLVEGQETDGEPYVEPAHDALVLGWSQLQRWKNEEQENIALQRLLTPAAEAWNINHRNARDLWANNSRLDRLIEIDKSNQSWLNQLETDFVRLSLKRKRNNRYWLVGSISVAFAALSILSIGMTWFSIESRLAEQQASARQLAAQADSLLNQPGTTRQEAGALLAVKALKSLQP